MAKYKTYTMLPKRGSSRTGDAHTYNVRVAGIVGIQGRELMDNVHDPRFDVLYVVMYGATTVFTDGDKIWYYKRSPYATSAEWRQPDVVDDFDDAIIAPQHKGLIKAALKGYLKGKGNVLEFTGRRMNMRHDSGPSRKVITARGQFTIYDISSLNVEDGEHNG